MHWKKRLSYFTEGLTLSQGCKSVFSLNFETCSTDQLQNCAILSRWQKVISPPPTPLYSGLFPLIELHLNIILFSIPSIFVGFFICWHCTHLQSACRRDHVPVNEVQKVSVVNCCGRTAPEMIQTLYSSKPTGL